MVKHESNKNKSAHNESVSNHNGNEHKDKYLNQALMLGNKVKKQYKHLSKRYTKQNLEIFRLYDWDIPEIAAVVDWYADHLVVAEYVKKNSDPRWLPMMAEAVAQSLDVEMQNVHIKQRHAGYQDGKRYDRVANTDKKIIMSERDLKFYINLDDYVDTGLFSDHRNTRQMVREMAQGKNFLNLYCYTGSFSCYAAKGGAKTTVSVDRSETAIQWAKDNMELNGIPVKGNLPVEGNFSMEVDIDEQKQCCRQYGNTVGNQENILIKSHTFDFLEKAKKKGQMFDLAVVDPPSFSSSRDLNLSNRCGSTSKSSELNSSSRDLKHRFDIVQDHPLLIKAVLEVMRKDSGSVIFFSTNHQDFQLDLDAIGVSRVVGSAEDNSSGKDCGGIEGSSGIKEIREITSITIPEDYKTPRKKIHRCWKILV